MHAKQIESETLKESNDSLLAAIQIDKFVYQKYPQDFNNDRWAQEISLNDAFRLFIC